MEQKGFSWQGLALLGAVTAYLLARPGVALFPMAKLVGFLAFFWDAFYGRHLVNILVHYHAGVLQGAFDYYILDKWERMTKTPYTKVRLCMISTCCSIPVSCRHCSPKTSCQGGLHQGERLGMPLDKRRARFLAFLLLEPHCTRKLHRNQLYRCCLYMLEG
jgi:hypothetical protein